MPEMWGSPTHIGTLVLGMCRNRGSTSGYFWWREPAIGCTNGWTRKGGADDMVHPVGQLCQPTRPLSTTTTPPPTTTTILTWVWVHESTHSVFVPTLAVLGRLLPEGQQFLASLPEAWQRAAYSIHRHMLWNKPHISTPRYAGEGEKFPSESEHLSTCRGNIHCLWINST